jgi:hypothetical protein
LEIRLAAARSVNERRQPAALRCTPTCGGFRKRVERHQITAMDYTDGILDLFNPAHAAKPTPTGKLAQPEVLVSF